MSNKLPERVNNPFGDKATTQGPTGALIESESQRSIQEVQAAMVIAKKFPRDQKDALDRILNACTRPTLAEAALYSYPRGGQEITGPSIRLAEAVAQEWGNMQFGIRELSQQNGESTVEAFAWDVQTNTRQVKVFQVPHARHTKQGKKALTDPRDIYELVANQGARRLRACILGVIPGDVIEAAVNQCEVTQKTSIETTPEALQKILESFQVYRVSKDMIEARIGMRFDSIRPAQVVALRKIYQSLRDGMSTAADWFEGDFAPPQAESSVNETMQAADAPVEPDASQETTAEPLDRDEADKPGNDAAVDLDSLADDLDF